MDSHTLYYTLPFILHLTCVIDDVMRTSITSARSHFAQPISMGNTSGVCMMAISLLQCNAHVKRIMKETHKKNKNKKSKYFQLFINFWCSWKRDWPSWLCYSRDRNPDINFKLWFNFNDMFQRNVYMYIVQLASQPVSQHRHTHTHTLHCPLTYHIFIFTVKHGTFRYIMIIQSYIIYYRRIASE